MSDTALAEPPAAALEQRATDEKAGKPYVRASNFRVLRKKSDWAVIPVLLAEHACVTRNKFFYPVPKGRPYYSPGCSAVRNERSETLG
jgi:hypothetical protein